MPAGQPLRGFVGQGMDGQRAAPAQVEPYSFPAAASAYSWSVPRTGKWKFVGWGPGGAGGSGGSGSGGSGGYFEITRQLRRGQTVTITAGQTASSDTSVVLPTGDTATATRATGGTAGAGTGGDVNLAGSAGATGAVNGTAGLGTGGGLGGATSGGIAGGAGAPANLPYRGSQGGMGSTGPGNIGSGGGETGVGSVAGGPGLVLAVLIKAS